MFALMKRLSSAVRQLAERHARLKGRAETLESQLAALTSELALVRRQLAAVGTVLVGFDSRVQPDEIAPIAAWKGKYGKRGGLRGAMLELLSAAEGHWLPTTDLYLYLRHLFDLVFVTQDDLRNWQCTVRQQLRCFLKEGLVEKSPAGSRGRPVWRLASAQASFSLDDLRALATEVGSGKLGA
jgi:hypothetical protein